MRKATSQSEGVRSDTAPRASGKATATNPTPSAKVAARSRTRRRRLARARAASISAGTCWAAELTRPPSALRPPSLIPPAEVAEQVDSRRRLWSAATVRGAGDAFVRRMESYYADDEHPMGSDPLAFVADHAD